MYSELKVPFHLDSPAISTFLCRYLPAIYAHLHRAKALERQGVFELPSFGVAD
jgi:hypothetical protein